MGKARIFVADDDKSYLELMKELLEEVGYSVTALRTANDAYEEIVQDLPDLLILDMVLEHPDTGWKVLDKVKLNPKTTSLPVIICSADVLTLRERQEHLDTIGCLTLEKPFDIDDLLAVIDEALGQGNNRTLGAL